MARCTRPHFLAALLLCSGTKAQILEVDTTWWTTDAPVRAIAEDTANNRVVIGGDFGRLLPPYATAFGAVVDLTTGVARDGDARPNDRVRCVLNDGSGGWYIGGDFTQVGGAARQGLAHVLADGSLAPWSPTVNGGVYAMAIKGDTLYFGGLFTAVNGLAHSNLAAVRLSTGANVVWGQALANAQVRTMTIDDGELFVGGDFTVISGQIRDRMAVFSTADHSLTTWAPTVGGPVHTIVIASYGVLVGGDFLTVNGLPRSNLALFNRISQVLTAWNPGPNATVRCMQQHGSNIYIGGDFTMVNASARGHLALVHSGGGLSTAWVNNTDDAVYSMHLVGAGTLLIGGQFSTVAGCPRPHAAALVTQGGSAPWLLPWAPAANANVRCFEAVGSNVYVGGGFDTLGVARSHVAMLHGSTGTPLAWHEDLNGAVNAIVVTPDRTFVGGDFDTTGTALTIRSNLAAFENSTGLLATWNPGTSGTVRSMAAHGGQLYVGGGFSFAGGVAGSGTAQIDAATGSIGPMDPGVASDALHVIGDTLYMGGLIFAVNGVLRRSLASVLLPSGTVTAFNPWVVHQQVPSIALDHITSHAGRVYFSGSFTTVDGQARRNYGCVNTTVGSDLGWDPGYFTPSSPVVVSNGLAYVVAAEDLGSEIALHALDLDQGDPTGAALVMDAVATSMVATASGDLLVGGLFTTISGRASGHFARVRTTPTIRVRALLQGPFNTVTQLMDNNLAQLAAIPLTEPYTALGYVHTGGGGGEVAPASINLGVGTNAIVDWVLIELRSASDPSVVVASRSALLQRDGDVVSHDLSPLLPFGPDPTGSFHIAIRHRNHLGAMMAAPVQLDANPLADFARGLADTYGTNATWSDPFYSLLWSGDVNFDGAVKYTGTANDRDPILVRIGGSVPTQFVIGYYNEDVTMNGVVKYTGSFNDRDPILVNIGGTLPTNVRVQQLP